MVAIILSEILGNDEMVPVHEVFFDAEKGLWYQRAITCFSSEALGLGTCQCNSHDHTETSVVSRKEVKSLLVKKSCGRRFLTAEEKDDLFHPSLERKIMEVFALKGMSWREVEEWAANCYKLDCNPLPTLRKLLNGVCGVGFAFYSPNTLYVCSKHKPTLVCWLDSTDQTVSFKIVRGD